jgi:uncharacterized RDD family membrane protein YckC
MAASGASGPRASFGRRVVAYLIDGVIIGIVYGILYAILGQAAAYGLSILVGLVYASYFAGSPSGQTVGKKVMGIRVIDFTNGGPIGFGRGVLRYVGQIISSIPCGLGFLWMLWDKEKQTWTDKIATTVVVPEADYPVEKWPG